MAEQLSLVRANDFTAAAADTVSLINYTDGFEITYEGWKPATAVNKDGRVREALTLKAVGSSTDNMAANVQKLADKTLQAARYFTDAYEDYAVWFRVQLDGETKGRQSLAYKVDHAPASSVYDVSFRTDHTFLGYTLGIERAPWWEGTALGTITASSVSVFGGAFSAGTIHGDMPARMAAMRITPNVVATADGTPELFPWGQAWLGWRSDRYGTPSAWPANKSLWIPSPGPGGRGYAYNRATADTYALAGTAIWYGFATAGTAEMMPMVYLTANEITGGTPANLRGSFLVLLRAKAEVGYSTISDNSEYLRYNVQLATGYPKHYGTYYYDLLGVRRYPRVPVWCSVGGQMNAYHLYELGEVTYPPPGRNLNLDTSEFALMIYAEKVEYPVVTDGSARLVMDSLIFIPTGEGYYWCGNPPNFETNGGAFPLTNMGTISMRGYVGPDGRAFSAAAGTAANVPLVFENAATYYRQGIPPGGTIYGVVACDDYDTGYSSHPSWKVGVNVNFAERWQTLRGND